MQWFSKWWVAEQYLGGRETELISESILDVYPKCVKNTLEVLFHVKSDILS